MWDLSRIQSREPGKGEKKGAGMAAVQSQVCPTRCEAAHIWALLPALLKDHVGRASGLTSLLEL